MFSKEMIAVLLDFYLDKHSPLVNFSEKKHMIGNRMCNFDALLQTVAHMVSRANKVPYQAKPFQPQNPALQVKPLLFFLFFTINYLITSRVPSKNSTTTLRRMISNA
jgi:hypothetical protein